MTDEAGIAEMVERDIMSFGEFSRFPDSSITDNIQSMLSSSKTNPAIKVSEDDGEISINCEIIVYFGINIPQLCYDIQSKVKHHIEESTGIPVREVNIRVEGVDRADPS